MYSARVAGKKKAGDLREAEDRFIDAVGGAIEFWGFKRILGHIWAWLYLEAAPRDAPAIGKRLGLSKAAVSTSLKELESWGCVSRIRRPGERRELFEAEQDIWAMVSRVFRQRELPRVQKAVETFDEVRETLEHVGGAEKAAARAMRERVERLQGMAAIGVQALESVLDQGLADVRPLRED